MEHSSRPPGPSPNGDNHSTLHMLPCQAPHVHLLPVSLLAADSQRDAWPESPGASLPSFPADQGRVCTLTLGGQEVDVEAQQCQPPPGTAQDRKGRAVGSDIFLLKKDLTLPWFNKV